MNLDLNNFAIGCVIAVLLGAMVGFFLCGITAGLSIAVLVAS